MPLNLHLSAARRLFCNTCEVSKATLADQGLAGKVWVDGNLLVALVIWLQHDHVDLGGGRERGREEE